MNFRASSESSHHNSTGSGRMGLGVWRGVAYTRRAYLVGVGLLAAGRCDAHVLKGSRQKTHDVVESHTYTGFARWTVRGPGRYSHSNRAPPAPSSMGKWGHSGWREAVISGGAILFSVTDFTPGSRTLQISIRRKYVLPNQRSLFFYQNRVCSLLDRRSERQASRFSGK